MASCARRWAALLVVAVAGALLLSSCGKDCCPAPKVTYPNRETPRGLLDYFAKSFEDKNLARCGECLWESYVFRFNPEDWDSAGVTPEKPYWGKTEDIASTEHMFASSAVTSIRFELHQYVTDFTGPDTLLTAIVRPAIDVTIEMPPGEEPITKQVRKSWLHFVLRPDPQNEHLWVIRQIQEEIVDLQLGHSAATEACTFGSLKTLFK
jgi:hypothetical protein